jgi:hypothetical protein
VCAHPLILKVFESFDIEFPHAKRTTYEQITAYLTLHLPNLKHAQLSATRAAANLVAATAYATLETESKRMHAELSQLKRQRPPRTNRNKKQKQNANGKGNTQPKTTGAKPTRPASESIATKKYCHHHGYQPSHTSSECKVLNGDKRKYNNEMRSAKDPHHPPGGPTKVYGQIVQSTPKSVTAHMAHGLDSTTDAQHLPLRVQAMEGSAKTPYEPANTLPNNLQAMEGSGKTPL